MRTVEITGGDDMKYSVTSIAAKPGETLLIRLVSKGTLPKIAMAHNVVVLKAGAKQIDFANAAATASATGYIPPDMKDQVLAATAMAGPGETVEVKFKVPQVAGSYPYLCTFPGHFAAGMRGDDRREVGGAASSESSPVAPPSARTHKGHETIYGLYSAGRQA